MTSKQTTLQKLQQQRDQLDARIKAAKAREREQDRKDDTRRKILIGALAKEHMETFPDSETASVLRGLLDKHITRAGDRNLLGLAPLSEERNPDIPANESAPDKPQDAGRVAPMSWPNR